MGRDRCLAERFEEAETQLKQARAGGGYRLTVLQIQRCPWCGSRFGVAQCEADPTNRRVYVYCGDELADCPFARAARPSDGLPVLTVDEEIYRLAPAFLIATVDKFARLAREGEAASLFGYVSRQCERHGYVHPDYEHCDIKDGSKHPAKNGLPPPRSVRSPAAPAGPDHPGRAAPDHRGARHDGRAVRGRGRRAASGAPGTAAGPAADRRLHRDRAEAPPMRPARYKGGTATVFPPPVLDTGRRSSPARKRCRRSTGSALPRGLQHGVRLKTAEIRHQPKC